MDALLVKARHAKGSVRGRPRTLWLSDPDLRNRVLSGIEARIISISAPKEIAAPFLDLVHRHQSIRQKNRLAEHIAASFSIEEASLPFGKKIRRLLGECKDLP